MTIAQQPEGIGRRACGEKVLSFKDLQLYQQNLGREHLIRCEAMAGRPNDSWIVIKVPQSNRTHVLCDFCDGDECNAKQWLEGPYSQSLTVMELIEHKRDTIRARRQACSDNLFAAKSPSQAPVLS